MSLPTNAATRKAIPIFSGLVKYFPHAIAAVAQLSRVGNDQHNPGLPLQWAKEKSSDEMDALLRHATDAAIEETHRDPDGVLAAVKLAWRALANLERMHDRGLDIFAETEDYAEAAASDLTLDELRSYQRTLPTTAEAWTRPVAETMPYIAELNRGYGEPNRSGLDVATPQEWDAVSDSIRAKDALVRPAIQASLHERSQHPFRPPVRAPEKLATWSRSTSEYIAQLRAKRSGSPL